MHIPKTIINKLIPFFSKSPDSEVFKQAKASIYKQQAKGCLEVISPKSWTRIWTTKLAKEDSLAKVTQFLIDRENLEDMGYGNTLEEAALGFDIEVDEDMTEEEFNQAQSDKLKRLARLAEKFPQFKDAYQSESGQKHLTLEIYELKKVIDLALAVAEASEINAPLITFSVDTNQLIHWSLNERYFNQKSYQADGLIEPVTAFELVYSLLTKFLASD